MISASICLLRSMFTMRSRSNAVNQGSSGNGTWCTGAVSSGFSPPSSELSAYGTLSPSLSELVELVSSSMISADFLYFLPGLLKRFAGRFCDGIEVS